MNQRRPPEQRGGRYKGNIKKKGDTAGRMPALQELRGG